VRGAGALLVGGSHRGCPRRCGEVMTDVVFVLLTLAFFALLGLLVKGLERL
jgi:hypothetical protein